VKILRRALRALSVPIPDIPVRYVIRPRSRRVSLRVDAAKREAVVVLPRARDKKRADKLIRDKSDWLNAHWQALPPALPFVAGGRIFLRGEMVELGREAGRGPAREEEGALFIPCPKGASFAGRTRRALIALARENLSRQASFHAHALGTQFSAMTVRDTNSRWGSCSATGRLNFSWRLICAPFDVLDYVCAHEVAHLIEHNHGPQFWALVEKQVGAAKAPRRWLRENASNLFAVGAEA
jgi:predicted metal-dependent hydrolase